MKACEAVVGTARFRERDTNPELRPSGRKAWSIYLSVLDDGPYLDVSVMPTLSNEKPNKRRKATP